MFDASGRFDAVHSPHSLNLVPCLIRELQYLMLLRRSAPILRSCARGTTLRSFPARSFTPTTTTSVFARAASTHAHTGQAFDFDTLVDMQQK